MAIADGARDSKRHNCLDWQQSLNSVSPQVRSLFPTAPQPSKEPISPFYSCNIYATLNCSSLPICLRQSHNSCTANLAVFSPHHFDSRLPSFLSHFFICISSSVPRQVPHHHHHKLPASSCTANARALRLTKAAAPVNTFLFAILFR